MDRARLFLVTGGSASGKSTLAQRLASSLDNSVTYLATGRATTPELAARIRKHQRSRPAHWPTVEAPRELAAALDAAEPTPVVLLEDLPSLVTNYLDGLEVTGDQLPNPNQTEREVRQVIETEIEAVTGWCTAHQVRLVVVTSEVGSGMLPERPLDRLFKDVLGHVNTHLASAAHRALAVISGKPVDLTALERQALYDLGLSAP